MIFLPQGSLDLFNAEELETLPAGTKPRLSDHRSPGGERCRKENAPDDLPYKSKNRQPDERWNCCPGDVGENCERRDGAHMGLSECIDTTLN